MRIAVYGDESGTMPITDDDEVFLAAACAVPDGVPEGLPLRRSRPRQLAAHLQDAGAAPMVAYIRPGPGYSATLSGKLDRMNTMARATRLRTGANTGFVPDQGLEPRNMAWTYATLMAVATSGLLLVLRTGEVPEGLDIYLDEKTLPDPLRNLARTTAKRVGATTARGARKLARAQSASQRDLLMAFADALDLAQTEIRISWSDEPNFAGSTEGLMLADSLAHHAYRELKKSGARPAIGAALQNAGYDRWQLDATPNVLRDLDRDGVRRWEGATGLPAPR